MADDYKQRQAQKEAAQRESRALELEEKLFPRPDAEDEFLSMDTVAVAREQLRALEPDAYGQSESDSGAAASDAVDKPTEAPPSPTENEYQELLASGVAAPPPHLPC